MNMRASTIYTNHPGGNLVHKHTPVYRRVCEAREKKKASLPSLALCFQPRSRPFVWLLAPTWIRKNTDCFAV